jgi:hypothetical protein
LADLKRLALTAYTPRGAIEFEANGRHGARELTLLLPTGCVGELLVPSDERVPLEELKAGDAPEGLRRFRVPAEKRVTLSLRGV